jgi:predicted hydrocarbon binding protein
MQGFIRKWARCAMNPITDFIISRLLSIDGSKVVLLNQIDFVMYPARSMAKVVQKIGEDFGDEYLFRLGYDAGMMVGVEFVEKFRWSKIYFLQRMNIIKKMFLVMGFGEIDIKKWDVKTDQFLMFLNKNPVIEHSISLFGNREKACTFYRGIDSAHLHNEMGVENAELIETMCMKNGADYCIWSHNIFKEDLEKYSK